MLKNKELNKFSSVDSDYIEKKFRFIDEVMEETYEKGLKKDEKIYVNDCKFSFELYKFMVNHINDKYNPDIDFNEFCKNLQIIIKLRYIKNYRNN